MIAFLRFPNRTTSFCRDQSRYEPEGPYRVGCGGTDLPDSQYGRLVPRGTNPVL